MTAPKAPIVSPWVRAALAKRLPPKARYATEAQGHDASYGTTKEA